MSQSDVPGVGSSLSRPSLHLPPLQWERPAVAAAVRHPPFFWLAMGGAAVAAVGAFLPWITASAALVGPIEVTGINGDGKWTLVLAGIVALLAVTGFRTAERSSAVAMTGIGCSALVIAVAGWDLIQGRRQIDAADEALIGLGRVSFGLGLYLTIAAGVAMLIACIQAERAAR